MKSLRSLDLFPFTSILYEEFKVRTYLDDFDSNIFRQVCGNIGCSNTVPDDKKFCTNPRTPHNIDDCEPEIEFCMEISIKSSKSSSTVFKVVQFYKSLVMFFLGKNVS